MDDSAGPKADPETDTGRQAGHDREEQGMTDKWTVRGISQETRRRAAMLARAADQPIGAWLTTLIASTPDKSDNASDAATFAARLDRLERTVFPSDMSASSGNGVEVDMRTLTEKFAALAKKG